MPRPVLFLAALALVVGLGAAGCADSVSPAAQVGPTTVTHDDLLTELEAWAGSPTLLSSLQIPASGSEADGYDMGFVGIVLSNRVAFELHNQEFDARGLELTEEDLAPVREQLLGDPATTGQALTELGDPYAEQLVADVARQFKLQNELGAEYPAWAEEAFTGTDIELSSRYGTWDAATGTVTAPTPPAGPGGGVFVEL